MSNITAKTKIKKLETQLKTLKSKVSKVVFLSPGFFCSETTTQDCKLGDIKSALKMMFF
jgi:hypothetical protein